MGPAASGSLLRGNNPRRTQQRFSFLRWSIQTPRWSVLTWSSVYRPKAFIFLARPSLRRTCRFIFACPRCSARRSTEDRHFLRSSAPTHVSPSLRAPSVSRPNVVSPTVAPRSLDPSLREGCGFDLLGAAGARSATLRARRRRGNW